MKKTHLAFSALVIVMSFMKCKNKDSNIATIHENAFSKEIILKENRIITTETINTQDIFVRDSFLVVNNSLNDSIFMVFNLNNFNCIKSWGIKGKGPGEYGTFKKLINISSDKFQIVDFSRYRIETYKIPEFKLKNSQKIHNKIPSGNREIPQNIASSNGVQYYYDNLFRHELSIKKWKNNKEPITINDLDYFNDSYESSSFYTGVLALNENQNKMVYAYNYFRRFDILNLDGKIITTVKVTPETASPAKRKSSNFLPKSPMCYMGIRAFDDRFFLYYVGHTPNALEKNNMLLPSYIEEYDWNGKPLKRYKLKRYVSNIDIIKKSNQPISFIGFDIANNNSIIIYNQDE